MSHGGKTVTIDKYTVRHTAVGDTITTIYCYSKYVGGTGYVGQINFFPKGNVPASTVSNDETGFYLCYEIDRYQDIIETFRYEKPIYAHIYWTDNHIIDLGYVSTFSEPVGEQEGPGGTPS